MRKQSKIWCALLIVLVALAASGCAGNGPAEGYSSDVGGATSPPDISPGTAAASESNVDEPTTGNETTTEPVKESEADVIHGPITALRLADDKIGWIGGEGWVARTDDGGATWRNQLESRFTVDQLFALNDQLVWASLRTGDEQPLKLMHSTDGGESWTETGTVPAPGFFHFVSAKEAFSDNAHTVDGGKTWTMIPVPKSTVGAPYFHDKDHGWAVTAEHEGSFDIIRTTDGGQSWHVVMSRDSDAPLNGALIRSAGKDDAWVQLIGDSGMTQTSYSLFHLGKDGKWLPVLAHDGAGSGPAPGYAIGEKPGVPKGSGTSPGALYVVDPQTAWMGGQCMACDDANTLGKTTDGGATWTELNDSWPGYGDQLLAATDADHVWLLTNDADAPARLYTSDDGGASWQNVYTFEANRQSE